ncbi:hypothetical protein D0267_08250 [Vibrio alginolyticus]|nr:hypothetical protein [Vibrio alginolyticus]
MHVVGAEQLPVRDRIYSNNAICINDLYEVVDMARQNKVITAINKMLDEHSYLTAKQIQVGLGYKSQGAVANALNRYISQGKLQRVDVLGLKAYERVGQ